MSSSTREQAAIGTGYLNAKDAAALDEELMAVPGYTLEQLMELAGLSVAEAVYQVLSEQAVEQTLKESPRRKILIICGPGNNGGDGLVAARHLVMFGYETVVVYPKQSGSKQPHYTNLVKQCQDVGVPILDEMPENWSTHYAIIVDAIFGFSFHGEPRPPFDTVIEQLKSVSKKNDNLVITVSIDVPSGWNVDGNDDDKTNKFVPNVLVSLTAPKLCAKKFYGRHFVGGRFLPPNLADKYNVRMPLYPGVSQVVQVSPYPSISK